MEREKIHLKMGKRTRKLQLKERKREMKIKVGKKEERNGRNEGPQEDS